MRGLGVSFLLRRARASWLLLACVAVMVLLTTGLAAVLWTFADAVVPFGAQGFLADPQDRVLGINGPVNAREAAADSQQIRAALRRAWPGVGFHLESALWTDQLQFPSSGNPTATRQIQLASLAGISAQVTLTAGTWPGPPHRGGPVPAALPAAAASQLHLTVGARLADLRLDGYTGRGIAPLAWLSALAMLVLCAAVMAWPALHAPAPDTARVRRGRQARLAGIAWAGGDLALVALAAVAVWELRGYSAVAHPATGWLGIDPVVALAPALALAGVAIIPLRGLPLLARLADKATDRERRLAAAMVSWQIARRPIRQAGPALLVVVAVATTTLALAGYASWRQSAADQAAFAVGSDIRVDAADQLPLGATGAITRAPGVTAATSASLASIANGGQLIALDASTAGKTILLRPDLSSLPVSALWRRITSRPTPGLVLPGQPERLEVLASLGAGPHSSPAEVRRDLGAATVTAWVSDSGGAIYQIPAAGLLPADGRTHALVVRLSGSRQASYPLRLLGLTLTYVLPPYDPANPQSAPAAGLSIESLAAAETAGGPFGEPFSHGAALAAWQGAASSKYVPAGPPNPGGTPP